MFMTMADDFWRFLLSARDRVTIDGFIGSRDNSGTKLERNDNSRFGNANGRRACREEWKEETRYILGEIDDWCDRRRLDERWYFVL